MATEANIYSSDIGFYRRHSVADKLYMGFMALHAVPSSFANHGLLMKNCDIWVMSDKVICVITRHSVPCVVVALLQHGGSLGYGMVFVTEQ